MNKAETDTSSLFFFFYQDLLLAIMDVDDAAVPLADCVIIVSIESEKIFVLPVNITDGPSMPTTLRSETKRSLWHCRAQTLKLCYGLWDIPWCTIVVSVQAATMQHLKVGKVRSFLTLC